MLTAIHFVGYACTAIIGGFALLMLWVKIFTRRFLRIRSWQLLTSGHDLGDLDKAIAHTSKNLSSGSVAVEI